MDPTKYVGVSSTSHLMTKADTVSESLCSAHNDKRWRNSRNSVTPNKGRIYSFGGPGATKMWRSLPATANLFYNNLFIINVISHNNYKYNQTFRGFKEANVSIKSVDPCSVSWRPPGPITPVVPP
jgi:hypothetical protein